MAEITTTGWIIIGATAVSTAAAGVSANVNQNAQAAARRATREQMRLERIQRQAEDRERYRQLRRERAAILQTTEDLGAASSTAGQSAVASAQTAGNIAQGFSDVTGQIANRINAFNISAAKKSSQAQLYGSISDIGFSLASLGVSAGGFGKTGNTNTQEPTINTTPKWGGLY